MKVNERDGKARLVIRADTTLKVLLNSVIIPNITVKKTGEKQV